MRMILKVKLPCLTGGLCASVTRKVAEKASISEMVLSACIPGVAWPELNTCLDPNKHLELCGWCVHCSKLKSTPASGPARETVISLSTGHFLFWDDLISCYKQLTSYRAFYFSSISTTALLSLMTGGKSQTLGVYPWDDVAVEEIQSAFTTEVSQLGKPLCFLYEDKKTKS